jgi:hypothetical protein
MQQQRGTGIKRGAVDKITRAFSPSGAVSSGWFSTADRIAASVIKFDRALEFGQPNILRHPETCQPSFWAFIHFHAIQNVLADS